MKWTKRVVADPGAVQDAPKHWFNSDATAPRALGAKPSPEAMVKLLSEEKLRLLRLIATKKPNSLRELATLSHRKDVSIPRQSRGL